MAYDSLEQIGRAARRIQDAVENVRGRSSVASVSVEVDASGRITVLEIDNPYLANAIVQAHTAALADAAEKASEIRRELLDDPSVARLAARFIENEDAPEVAATSPAIRTPGADLDDEQYYQRQSWLK